MKTLLNFLGLFTSVMDWATLNGSARPEDTTAPRTDQDLRAHEY